MNKNRLKNWLVNATVLALSLVVVFAIAEMIVRILYKQETVLFPRYHTDAHYGEFTLRRLRPNSEFWHSSRDGSWKFTTNSRGLRNDQDFPYAKPEGVIRVLSLGDSHTQGYEVRQDYTYSAVISRYLNWHGIKAEVINAGISGFSTAEELLYLENEGIRYAPDFVVLGFFANDYQDNIKANFFKLDENGDLVVQKKSHIPGVKIQNIIYALPFVKFLSEHSYFYSLMFNNTWEFFKTRLARRAAEQVNEYAIATEDTLSDYQLALTAALIKRMYAFCEKNNIRLIILDIPRVRGQRGIQSSFDKELVPVIASNSDAYFVSDALLADYSGVAELHVPHGHRHISEFTHTLLGVAVAKKIQQFVTGQ
jgi:lysophospholipase L1-like esterase